jgi:hypothetical protein
MKRLRIPIRKGRTARASITTRFGVTDRPASSGQSEVEPVNRNELERRRAIYERVMKLRAQMEPLSIPVDELLRRERGLES